MWPRLERIFQRWSRQRLCPRPDLRPDEHPSLHFLLHVCRLVVKQAEGAGNLMRTRAPRNWLSGNPGGACLRQFYGIADFRCPGGLVQFCITQADDEEARDNGPGRLADVRDGPEHAHSGAEASCRGHQRVGSPGHRGDAEAEKRRDGENPARLSLRKIIGSATVPDHCDRRRGARQSWRRSAGSRERRSQGA